MVTSEMREIIINDLKKESRKIYNVRNADFYLKMREELFCEKVLAILNKLY